MLKPPLPRFACDPSSPQGVEGIDTHYHDNVASLAVDKSACNHGVHTSSEWTLSRCDESRPEEGMNNQLCDDGSHNSSLCHVSASQQSSGATAENQYENEEKDLFESSSPNILGQKQRFFRGKPVKPKNQHLPEHVLEFKQRRKVRTVASAWTGGIIGFVSAGPLGAALGATTAYGIAKGVGKAKERRLVESSGGHVKPNEVSAHRALYQSALV